MGGTAVIETDLAIIGSGGGAFAAAIRATSLGQRVVMVERSTVGGTCVNTGCVPSKALLAAAGARHVALDASGRFPGLAASAGPVDMPGLMAGKDGLVEGMRSEKYVDLIADYGWDLRRGEAAFTGTAQDPVLEITGRGGAVEEVRAGHYLVATGSAPWAPPIPGLEDVDYLTSTTAMELPEVPESMIVLGGGYVALEQAQLFARLGSQVTVLARSRLLSGEEPEVSKTLMGVFADEGIQVGVATGERGEILVEDTLASSHPRIWAAGDVTGHPEFVYVASAHGVTAVENAFHGAGQRVDYTHLPRVTFTSPAVGAVGMTDKQAREAGIRCECRVLPLEYVPRALVNRDTRGFIKIVADADTGRIVGITAVAQEAGDLAAAGVYILSAGMTVDQVATLWCPYLTMAEGVKIAAQSFRTDVSKLSCCAA